MTKPIMKCGHAANGTQTLPDNTKIPVCVICFGIGGLGGNQIDESQPDLENRISRCRYYNENFKCTCTKNHCPPTQHSQHGGNFPSVGPSSTNLPFFAHRPKEKFDSHFCGCWGWD